MKFWFLEPPKSASRALRAPSKIFPESPIKKCRQPNEGSSSVDGPNVIKQTPISKLPRHSISRISHKWLNADVDEGMGAKPIETLSSRKRLHDSAQNVLTKKQKVTDETVKKSCYNLSILFYNFQ